jgi:hypothetical protein
MEFIEIHSAHRGPWNKGKLTRQKIPLKLKEIWAIRVRLPWKSRLLHCLWHIPFAVEEGVVHHIRAIGTR